MPQVLTNRTNDPVFMEQVWVHKYLQGGADSETPFFNNSATKAILPGEPISIYGKLGISKSTILPRKFGTVLFNCLVEFVLDPAQATDIHHNDLVYFKYDLAAGLTVANVYQNKYITGFASTVATADNFLLGYAVPNRQERTVYETASPNKPICAQPGDKTVTVLMVDSVTSVGTVPNFVTGA